MTAARTAIDPQRYDGDPEFEQERSNGAATIRLTIDDGAIWIVLERDHGPLHQCCYQANRADLAWLVSTCGAALNALDTEREAA